jgi:hypothetical protein
MEGEPEKARAAGKQVEAMRGACGSDASDASQ